MTATRQWVDGSPRILIHKFVGQWSTSEFEAEILGETPEIVRYGDKVVVMIDFLQYTMPSRNINIFPTLRRFTDNRPPNIQMIILVVRDGYALSLLNLVKRVLPKTNIIFAVKSLAEAWELITKDAETQE